MQNSLLSDIREARCAAQGLTVFRTALDDPIGQSFLTLLAALNPPAAALAETQDALATYCRLFALLAEEMEFYEGSAVGDAWQNHLLDCILSSENAFSRKAELAGPQNLGPSLLDAVRRDLPALETLFHLDAATLATATASACDVPDEHLPRWDRFSPLLPPIPVAEDEGGSVKDLFLRTQGWGSLVESLAEHYRAAGSGIFAHFRAFRWGSQNGHGRLQGIANPDPIQLEDLIGYERERAILVENTEHFVAGLPANNVLLYGDRGTGKSSTVKALLNAYHGHGLRLIEVAKQQLADYPQIIAMLRQRGERFILFVDDLSFEDNEIHYKELKAALEGGIEERPDNVLVYATSNRRHLIREHFSDRREDRDDEVHGADTVEEKLSLGDRFGITVTFFAPDQDRYLAVVEGLARRRGLAIAKPDLHRRALQWAAHHNGRSGRTARQFVDHLQASLLMVQQR